MSIMRSTSSHHLSYGQWADAEGVTPSPHGECVFLETGSFYMTLAILKLAM